MSTDADYTMSFKDLTGKLNKKPKVSTVQRGAEGLRIEELQGAGEETEAEQKLGLQKPAAVEEKPKKERRAPGAIDKILLIASIALGAAGISIWLGGAVVNRSIEISAKIDDALGSSSISGFGEGIIDAKDETVPAASTPSMDVSWAWPIIGIAGGGAGAVFLTVLSVGAIKRSRRTSLELRELEEARAEDRRKARAAWQKYADAHSELKAKILEAETDWDMLFSYPTLVDASVPQTRELHRAIRALDAAPADPPAELNLSMAIGELHYPKLVAEAQEAWNLAWSFAQRTGLKLIPKPERKKIDQIVKLLKLARDGGGSEHERSVAYERAAKLIGELHFVRIPEAAMRSIEAERRPMIEAPSEASSLASQKAERVPVALSS